MEEDIVIGRFFLWLGGLNAMEMDAFRRMTKKQIDLCLAVEQTCRMLEGGESGEEGDSNNRSAADSTDPAVDSRQGRNDFQVETVVEKSEGGTMIAIVKNWKAENLQRYNEMFRLCMLVDPLHPYMDGSPYWVEEMDGLCDDFLMRAQFGDDWFEQEA